MRIKRERENLVNLHNVKIIGGIRGGFRQPNRVCIFFLPEFYAEEMRD